MCKFDQIHTNRSAMPVYCAYVVSDLCVLVSNCKRAIWNWVHGVNISQMQMFMLAYWEWENRGGGGDTFGEHEWMYKAACP